MDLTSLENKLNSFSQQPFSPNAKQSRDSELHTAKSMPTVSNPFTSSSVQNKKTEYKQHKQRDKQQQSSRPVSVTKKINEVSDEDVESYSEKLIPDWKDLQKIYEGQWKREKDKFQTHLKANFAALVERFASGKQELFQLCAPERRERLYIEAFLELFESGYAPHVGDVERLAGKRVRKLYITLPNNYSSIY
tara:strand:- start:44 stop:619 length:576 start_codon:yes stop_codon:yes gene_type:complete